jgi:hypothetical protein
MLSTATERYVAQEHIMKQMQKVRNALIIIGHCVFGFEFVLDERTFFVWIIEQNRRRNKADSRHAEVSQFRRR